MQTNYTQQLHSLIAYAVGTLQHQIDAKGVPSEHDAEIKVLKVKGNHQIIPDTDARVTEVCRNGLITQYGILHYFNEVDVKDLFKLIDQL